MPETVELSTAISELATLVTNNIDVQTKLILSQFDDSAYDGKALSISTGGDVETSDGGTVEKDIITESATVEIWDAANLFAKWQYYSYDTIIEDDVIISLYIRSNISLEKTLVLDGPNANKIKLYTYSDKTLSDHADGKYIADALVYVPASAHLHFLEVCTDNPAGIAKVLTRIVGACDTLEFEGNLSHEGTALLVENGGTANLDRLVVTGTVAETRFAVVVRGGAALYSNGDGGSWTVEGRPSNFYGVINISEGSYFRVRADITVRIDTSANVDAMGVNLRHNSHFACQDLTTLRYAGSILYYAGLKLDYMCSAFINGDSNATNNGCNYNIYASNGSRVNIYGTIVGEWDTIPAHATGNAPTYGSYGSYILRKS